MSTQYVISREDFKKADGSEIKLNRYNSLIQPNQGKNNPVSMDPKVCAVLRDIAKDPIQFERVVQYLNDNDYGCRRVPGALETAIEKLKGPHAPNFAWNKNYQSALRDASKHFGPRRGRLVPECVDTLKQIEQLLPKKDSHAGYSYWLTDKRTKGEYLEKEFVEEFHESQLEAINAGTFNLPILIGIRLQESGAFDENGNETPDKIKYKERMVNMVDIHQILTELMFSRPVQQLFAASKSYAGGKQPEELHMIINNRRASFKEWLSLDYSAYDQTIPGWLIQDCFQIIKGWFILNEKQEALLEVVSHDFITKSIVWKDGQLIWVHDGVPSGSMFTQIIDTLANWIMIRTYMYAKSYEDQAYECNICGDDNLIFHDGFINSEDLCSYITKNFGIIAHPDKCTSGVRSDDPEYLSRKWQWKGIYRNPKELIAKMIFPERWRDYRRNKQLQPEMIVYSYYLCYDQGMKEFFDMDKFFDMHGHRLRDIPASNFEHMSGFFSYQFRYNPSFKNRLLSSAQYK